MLIIFAFQVRSSVDVNDIEKGEFNLRTTILNGNPDEKNTAFESCISSLSTQLEEQGQEVSCHPLREYSLKMCKGCFGCWHRTPGECVAKDASAQILRSVINSDFLLFTSPVKMGYTSVLLKTVMDKFLPLLHPFVFIRDGEMRHKKRYARYPDWGLLLEKQGDTDDEDIDIVTECFRRGSLNFHADFRFSKLITQPINEVVDAIIRV